MELFIASGNFHKFDEFLNMFMGAGFFLNLYHPQSVGGMPQVEENGTSFEENARLKATALLAKVGSGEWVLADDSGLSVDALNGAPGIFSSRYAGPSANAAANNLKLLKELLGVPTDKRTAHFSCVLILARKGRGELVFEGTCKGSILEHPRGDEGFGYDPLFVPEGHDKTFAELGPTVKDRISHRAKAFLKMINYLREREVTP